MKNINRKALSTFIVLGAIAAIPSAAKAQYNPNIYDLERQLQQQNQRSLQQIEQYNQQLQQQNQQSLQQIEQFNQQLQQQNLRDLQQIEQFNRQFQGQPYYY